MGAGAGARGSAPGDDHRYRWACGSGPLIVFVAGVQPAKEPDAYNDCDREAEDDIPPSLILSAVFLGSIDFIVGFGLSK